MPELPEVETTRLKIEPYLLGQRLLRLEHGVSRRYQNTHLASGRTVTRLSRRGKYLLLHLEDPGQDSLELIVHLGMTGGFRFVATPHTRVTMHIEDAEPLYFQDVRRFGKMAVVQPGVYPGMPTLSGMGPEPLGETFSEQAFVRAVAGGGKMIKPWLLSQVPVAGVGNIYADESLWAAQIHPAQTRLKPAEVRRLYEAIRTTMQAAVEAGGSTLSDGSYQQPDGLSGSFQTRHNVYDRAGQSCNRCGSEIIKTVLAQRGTHFCPKCQTLKLRP